MFDALFIVSLAGSLVQLIKESKQTVVPVENWGNKELYHKDMMNGVSAEQRMKNLENGRYKLAESHTVNHPAPHRDSANGRIVIENCKLYHEDVDKYGAVQAQRWVRDGRYNLDGDGLKREKERIRKQYEYLYSLA